MATQLKPDPIVLDSLLVQQLDQLVTDGRFTSREEVVREGLRLLREQETYGEVVDFDKLDPETRAVLEERIAEADADPDGGIPAEQVFAELRQRYQNWE